LRLCPVQKWILLLHYELFSALQLLQTFLTLQRFLLLIRNKLCNDYYCSGWSSQRRVWVQGHQSTKVRWRRRAIVGVGVEDEDEDEDEDELYSIYLIPFLIKIRDFLRCICSIEKYR
jgi:hypothetical protein